MSTGDALRRRRLRLWLQEYAWLLIGLLWVAAVVLGYLGFRALAAAARPGSFWDTLYLSFQLFPLQSGVVAPPVPWQLEIARFLAPAVLAATAIGAVVAVFGEQLRMLGVRRMRDHVVVCGLGERGLLLAEAFSRDHQVVAIEDDTEARGIGEAREEGVIVMTGDATDRTVLRRARVERARYLIAVGGDDGTNAEIAVDARALAGERPNGRLDAFVHVVDPTLCSLLREHHPATGRSGSYHLRFFNVFEAGTRAWLAAFPPFPPGKGRDAGRPHLVVVGVGQMGRSLVVGAVRSWLTLHPEAALRPELGLRPKITLVDRAAEAKRTSLLVRHPRLGELCDLVACQLDVASPEFEQAEFMLDTDGRRSVSAVYVCLDDDSLGLSAALTLLHRIGRDLPPVPVVVRMRQDGGLAGLLDGGEGFESLHSFALLGRTCTTELLLGETTDELVARAIHADYVRRSRAAGESVEASPFLVGWDELPEDLKESNRRQADHVAVKLRAVGCAAVRSTDGAGPEYELSAAEIEYLAEMEHDRWAAERLFEGWTYAPGEKDLERKVSPCLVPWADLSEDVKELDRAAVRGLPAFLAEAGLRMVRVAKEAPDDD